MGCWNETCAITNLPILNGEEVVMIPLLQYDGSFGANRHYTAPYWKVLPFYIEGEYDDYGGLENYSGETGFIKFLHENAVEVTDSRNKEEIRKYSPKDIQTLEDYFSYESDEHLLIPNLYRGIYGTQYTGKVLPDLIKVSHVFILKRVITRIIDQWQYGSYDRVLKTWRTLTWKEILSSLPALKDRIEKKKEEVSASSTNGLVDLYSFTETFISKKLRLKTEELSTVSFDERLLITACERILYSSSSEGVFHVIGKNAVLDVNFFFNVPISGVMDLLTTFLKIYAINTFLDVNRMTWAPTSHRGSQDAEFDTAVFRADLIKEVVTDVKRQHYDDEEE